MYVAPNSTVDTAYHKTCVGLADYSNGTVAETGRCDSGYDYDLHKYSTLVTEVKKLTDKTRLAPCGALKARELGFNPEAGPIRLK